MRTAEESSNSLVIFTFREVDFREQGVRRVYFGVDSDGFLYEVQGFVMILVVDECIYCLMLESYKLLTGVDWFSWATLCALRNNGRPTTTSSSATASSLWKSVIATWLSRIVRSGACEGPTRGLGIECDTGEASIIVGVATDASP